MMRTYHQLPDEPRGKLRTGVKRELTEVEEELLGLLKSRGVPSICDSISKEINYVWAVTSGFKTLASVGHFYFACGSQTFGYNPAYDFFAANGMQLALFALQKFIHNESVLVPVLECIHIYSKLHVDGALEFLAIGDSTEILMNCVRFHDNRHDVISTACQALGSLVMNDLVKETVSSPALVLELLGLVKRYHSSQATCRGALVPLGFLVTDATITATFVDANGIALTMATMKRFIKDTELVWHAIGILNGLHAKTVDSRLIFAAFGFTGIPRLVEALASHLDTEEIAVEGFQLLAKLAAHREAYAAINASKVLDLAYVALFAYSGPQHRHTRLAIKRAMHPFQKCTLYDACELAQREQVSRADLLLYALLLLCFLLASVLSLYDHHANDLVLGIERALVDRKWSAPSSPSQSVLTLAAMPSLGRSLRDVNSVDDVWSFLLGPLHESLFQDRWYNGDLFAADTHSQLGAVERSNWLLGGLQLRVLRVRNATCGRQQCYPAYSRAAERTSAVETSGFSDRWTASLPHAHAFDGRLASYPANGYRRFIPRLNATSSSNSSSATCGPYCQLVRLRDASWLDRSSRALFAEFNLYNGATDAHCAVTLLFEFAATGGVVVTVDITPMHLDPYPYGIFLFAPRFYVDVALLAALGWFAHKQVLRTLRYRWFTFVVAGHVIDFSIVALWVAAIALRLQLLASASHALLVQLAAGDTFVDLSHLARLVRMERSMLAWAAFAMWWRLFRFAKCLKPLKAVMDKFERAGALLHAFAALLALYVVGFAHAGALLFSASHAGFRSLDISIASMSRRLFRRWGGEEASDAPALLFRVLFQLSTTFVLLNIAVAILRERFDSDRGGASKAKGDAGDELLAIARKQLEASGMSVHEVSLSKKLRRAAARGIETLQHATREIFTATDNAAELTSLKRVWGLQNANTRSGRESDSEPQESSAVQHAQSLLLAAEELDRQLDEQLRYFAMRVGDAMRKLQSFERLVREQIEEREMLEAEQRERVAIAAVAAARREEAERLHRGEEQCSVAPELLPSAVSASDELSAASDGDDDGDKQTGDTRDGDSSAIE